MFLPLVSLVSDGEIFLSTLGCLFLTRSGLDFAVGVGVPGVGTLSGFCFGCAFSLVSDFGLASAIFFDVFDLGLAF